MSVQGVHVSMAPGTERADLESYDATSHLLERIAAGDRQALARLYEVYNRALFRYLCQLTPDRGLAEEILQDTFVAAWRSAGSFENRASAQAWLFGIARRQAHNSVRRKGLPIAGDTDLDEVADRTSDPETIMLAGLDREALADAVGELAVIHREILSLVFVQGLSYQECAAVLEIPEGTVKSRLSNARRALRSRLSSARER